MLPWLVFTLIFRVAALSQSDENEEECIDKSPYCNTNDCTVRPGYALEYCKKTCGDCEPFCHNSHFVSCKESRKPECDSMLKDYCPLLCGACRPVRKKSSRRKGSKVFSKKPLSVASLGSSLKLPNFKVFPVNASMKRTSTVSVISATTEPSVSLNYTSAEVPAQIFSSPPEEESTYPDPFLENPVDPSSAPITIDDYFAEIEMGSTAESTPTELNVTQANLMFPPEPMRIPSNPTPNHRPPTRLRRPPNEIAPTVTYAWPPMQASLNRGYHPAHPPSQLLLPYPRNPQPHPMHPLTSPANPYNSGFYASPTKSAFMEGILEPPMDFGNLIMLLGCHDRDPVVCSKINDESCLSRPGYYLKLCPVKCRNCTGLQCLDSIKIDCSEVQRLGGCKLPTAAEYCPRTCRLCTVPSAIADSLPPCKDELETCENLVQSGVCEHPYSRRTMRIYCAKSCGFCREPQYYMNEAPYQILANDKKRLNLKTRNPIGYERYRSP